MPTLSDQEAGLLGEISPSELWRHAETLAQWEKTSGTPGERAAVAYLGQQLESFGVTTICYEFESLLGWPEEAALALPEGHPLAAITHAFTPSTAAHGLTGELIYLATGEPADFAGQPVAGKVGLIEGMPTPGKVLRGQQHAAAALIFIQDDRLLHELCVSPVWGTPTPRTAEHLPRLPVVSTTRSDGELLKERARQGPATVWLRTRTFWGWRTTPLLVGELPGTIEPERFVLLSGHHCSWYYGAMDNGAADATILEVARVLARHPEARRRGVRIAFWPGHTQGRYSGSTWYSDQFWEELHDHCVLHVNVDSTGARGATFYHAMSMPQTQAFALAAIADAIGVAGEPSRQSRAGDQSFWGCGVPSIFMDLSAVPGELAATTGPGRFTAADQPALPRPNGLPWWWHTPEDTIDKLDPAVLERDTRVYLLATVRAAGAPILPFVYAPAARQIRTTLERYQTAAGDRFDLGPALVRARQVENACAAFDALLAEARGRPDGATLAAVANRGAMALDRALVPLDFTASGPFDHDLAVPIPSVPLLAAAANLADQDPAADATRFLLTALVRQRNQVAFALRQAREAADTATATLRQSLRS
jgi:hypothetical protein